MPMKVINRDGSIRVVNHEGSPRSRFPGRFWVRCLRSFPNPVNVDEGIS